MLDGVRRCLRRDEVRGRLDLRRKPADLLAADLDVRAGPCGEHAQRRRKATLRKLDGMNAVGEPTQFLDRIAQALLGSRDEARRLCRLIFDHAANVLELESHRDELLLRAVVEVANDRPTGGVRRPGDASPRSLHLAQPQPISDVVEDDDGAASALELDRCRGVRNCDQRAILANEEVLIDSDGLSGQKWLQQRALLRGEVRAVWTDVVNRLVAPLPQEFALVAISEDADRGGVEIGSPAVGVHDVQRVRDGRDGTEQGVGRMSERRGRAHRRILSLRAPAVTSG